MHDRSGDVPTPLPFVDFQPVWIHGTMEHHSMEKLLDASLLSEASNNSCMMDGITVLPGGDDTGGYQPMPEDQRTEADGCAGMLNMNFITTIPEQPEYDEILQQKPPDQLVPDFILGLPQHCSTPKKNGRPVSMYEPWIAAPGAGLSSLPAEVLRKATRLVDIDSEEMSTATAAGMSKTCWEAEDADEFITTLDESAILDIESYEDLSHIYSKPGVSNNNNQKLIVAADVHHHQHHHLEQEHELQQQQQQQQLQYEQRRHHQQQGGGSYLQQLFEYPEPEAEGPEEESQYDAIEIYATVKKKKKPREQTPQSAIDRTIMVETQALMLATSSGAPMEKFPKIMTSSCYGELNGDYGHDGGQTLASQGPMTWIQPGAIVKSNENLLDSARGGGLSMNSSIIDELPSGGSSLYEPNSMNSSIDFGVRCASNERSRVRWWDDFTEETEAELQDIAEKEHDDSNMFRKSRRIRMGTRPVPARGMNYDGGTRSVFGYAASKRSRFPPQTFKCLNVNAIEANAVALTMGDRRFEGYYWVIGNVAIDVTVCDTDSLNENGRKNEGTKCLASTGIESYMRKGCFKWKCIDDGGCKEGMQFPVRNRLAINRRRRRLTPTTSLEQNRSTMPINMTTGATAPDGAICGAGGAGGNSAVASATADGLRKSLTAAGSAGYAGASASPNADLPVGCLKSDCRSTSPAFSPSPFAMVAGLSFE
ncbi:hypothetical protein AND_004771 [Anopheles darlingi]|uniref:Uncharacterized protein n=1 Tax=Anopheles darlingi TaxID=43151 RepID=W5JHG1_ANODA|nr:hypothetical protein AND_004771 [Anopheles darlingi]